MTTGHNLCTNKTNPHIKILTAPETKQRLKIQKKILLTWAQLLGRIRGFVDSLVVDHSGSGFEWEIAPYQNTVGFYQKTRIAKM